MSYLFVVAIGAVAGFVFGLQMKGSDLPAGLDAAAGAVGGALVVLLSRLVLAEAAAGFFMSFVVAIIGGALGVYAMRKYMKSKEAPVPVVRRRRS